MSKIKIMHLLQSDRFSGAENVVCQIMEMFRGNEDYEMIYVSPDGPISSSLKERNIPFYGLERLDYKNVRLAIKEINPNIIHAHDVSAGLFATLAAKKNIKIISHMHVNNSNMSKLNIKTLVYRFMAIRFSHIFWVSNSSYQSYFFKNNISKKSTVLFNVVDKVPIIKKSNCAVMQDAYDVIFIGRMQYQKNPQKLLNIFKILKEDYNCDFSAVIIGEGPLFHEIVEKKHQLGLDDNVKMLGFVENPMGLLKKAKLMLLTSRFEGTPMCALEAMALGVPIISTPTDGMLDLIDSGINGFLDDDDRKLATDIKVIINDLETRRKMSESTKDKFDSLMDLNIYKRELEVAYGK